MGSTVWHPYRAYEQVQWVLNDLSVVGSPALEISGSGRRVRFAGAGKSFNRSDTHDQVKARMKNAWFRVETYNPSGAVGVFDPSMRTMLTVAVVYSTPELPFRARNYLRVHMSGSGDRRTYSVRTESRHSAAEKNTTEDRVFDGQVEAMKFVYKTLRSFDTFTAVSPAGKQVHAYPTPDSENALARVTSQVKGWFDVRADLKPAGDAYQSFRYEMQCAGLALPPMKEDRLAQLLSGHEVVLDVNAELSDFAKGDAGALVYDPARAQFTLTTHPLVSEDLISEWFAVQKLAEMHGRTDDLRAFALEYASKLALQAARRKG